MLDNKRAVMNKTYQLCYFGIKRNERKHGNKREFEKKKKFYASFELVKNFFTNKIYRG